jgi:flavin-dependent dehydrogenase
METTMHSTQQGSLDVLVLGGGPGGSTVAALLAMAGCSVVLCEKERFPRFHIGESFLPYNRPLLERLGVVDQIQAMGFQRKWGARFVFEPSLESVHLDFERGLNPRIAQAFHARRADFDHILLQNARAKGADVREEESAEAVLFEEGRAVGARIRRADHSVYEVRARLVVDATGRDGLMGAQLALRKRDPKLRQAALFSHYENAEMGLGKEGGDILVVGGPFGWFWLIPLDAKTTSVGVVFPGQLMAQRQGRDLESFFAEIIASSPTVSHRLRDAQRIAPVRPAADFSYRCSAMAGDGWAMVGDAACFLDPVFSSGVFLAMGSAQHLADLAAPRLRRGQILRPAEWRSYQRFLTRGLDRFRRFILAFYDPAGSSLLRSQPPEMLYSAAVTIFAGKVFTRDPRIWFFENFFDMAAGQKRREARAGKADLGQPPASDAMNVV